MCISVKMDTIKNPGFSFGILSLHLHIHIPYLWGFPGSSAVKNLPAMQESQEMGVQSPGREDPLKEGMATHSSIFAWRISCIEESRGL